MFRVRSILSFRSRAGSNKLFLRSFCSDKSQILSQIEKKQKEILDSPSVKTYNELIQAYKELKDLPKALDAYEEMGKQGIEGDEETFQLLTELKRQAANPEDTPLEDTPQEVPLETSDTPLEDTPQGTNQDFDALIQMYVKLNEPQNAIRCFEEMKQKELPISSNSYHHLINIYFSQHLLKKAIQTFEDMMLHQIQPSPDLLNLAVLMYAVLPDPERSKYFFTRIKEEGLTRTEESYQALFKMYCVLGQPKDAIDIFQQMTEAHFKPDRETYEQLLDCYTTVNDPKNTIETFEKMKKADMKPNSEHYAMVIKAYVRLNQLDDVLKLIQEMKSAGLSPNLIAYKNLISMFISLQRPESAIQAYDEMRQNGILPDSSVYRNMILTYVHLKKIEEALDLYDEMKTRGVVPDNATYAVLIASLSIEHSPQISSRILSLFDEMKEPGIRSNPLIQNSLNNVYNSILKMHLNTNDLPSFHKVFNEMKERSMNLVDGYRILIRHYARNNQHDQAIQILRQMQNDKMNADSITYNALMKALYSQEKYDNILALFAEMKDKAIVADVVTYNYVLMVYTEQNDLIESAAHFTEMQKSGLYPNAATYVILLNYFLELHDITNILMLANAFINHYMVNDFPLDQIDQELQKQGMKVNLVAEYAKIVLVILRKQWNNVIPTIDSVFEKSPQLEDQEEKFNRNVFAIITDEVKKQWVPHLVIFSGIVCIYLFYKLHLDHQLT